MGAGTCEVADVAQDGSEIDVSEPGDETGQHVVGDRSEDRDFVAVGAAHMRPGVQARFAVLDS